MRFDTLQNAPFTSAAEHMAAEFRWLDARLADHLRLLREEGRFDESALRGLRLDESAVLAGLAPGRKRTEPPADRLREIIDARAAAGDPPPLYGVAEAFGLDAFERAALMIAAAPALDARYRAALALAQNDATRHGARPDLIIELLEPANRFARLSCFAPDAPLMRHRLLSAARAETPLADRQMAVDDRVAMALLGRAAGLPADLAPALAALDPEAEDWAPELLEKPPGDRPVLVFDAGGRDSGQRALAARRARDAGLGLLCLEPARLPDMPAETVRDLVVLAAREARLTRALLYVEAGDLARSAPTVPALAGLVAAGESFVLSASAEVAHLIAGVDPDRVQRIALAPLDPVDRLRWWRRASPEADDPRVARLAWQSRLGPAGIGRRRGLAPDDAGGPMPPLPALLRPVHARWTRADLVLSDTLAHHLDELTAFVSNWPRVLGDWGFGASDPQSRHCLALFSGPSGTGKTMAASVVAKAAGLPLYRASLAAIFDKYLGETEKQIDRLFNAAAEAGIAILCDEADALFGARTEVNDAHARYANLTVSHLLQRVEEHEGLVILTSNLPRNMDEAFARRIRHSLAFTLPDAAGRHRLWRGAIPQRADLGADVDLAAIAETFELSGGAIRNAALAAAYLAAAGQSPIRMRHLLRAIERELAKNGRTPIAADFGRLAAAR